MRSIEEFKQDRENWNREAQKRHQLRFIIGWVIALIVLAAAGIGGWKAYQNYQANQDNAKPKSQDIQAPGN